MKILIHVILVAMVCQSAFGQKMIAEKSAITFFSYAPIEDIEAVNTKSKSIINLDNGDIVFSVPIKGFVFEKALMQEHFNENYMESDKYPYATFVASFDNWKKFEGAREVATIGNLTIHGVENRTVVAGRITIEDEIATVDAKFNIKVADHGIKIPTAVFYNIAKEIEVELHFEYVPYVK